MSALRKTARRRKNPGIGDYLSAAKKAVVKHGSRIASEIAEETHAIATRAKEEAAKAEKSRVLTSPEAALEVLAKSLGYALVKTNPRKRNPKKSKAKKSPLAKLRRSESRALTSSLFRLGGTQGVSGLRALRNPAVPPLSEWKKEGNVRSVEIGDTTYAIVALSGVNKGILSTVYRRGVKGGELGRSLLLRDARALAVTHAGQ
jgi:hypothetical protein